MRQNPSLNPKPETIAKMERRAAWVIALWNDEPCLTYLEYCARIRTRFQISEFGAQQAYKRAGEHLRATFQTPEFRAQCVARHAKLSDLAERAGNHDAASRILERGSRLNGDQAVQKVELAGVIGIDHAHAAALKLTPAKRAQRMKELLAKAEGAAEVVTTALSELASPEDDEDPDESLD